MRTTVEPRSKKDKLEKQRNLKTAEDGTKRVDAIALPAHNETASSTAEAAGAAIEI